MDDERKGEAMDRCHDDDKDEDEHIKNNSLVCACVCVVSLSPLDI